MLRCLSARSIVFQCSVLSQYPSSSAIRACSDQHERTEPIFIKAHIEVACIGLGIHIHRTLYDPLSRLPIRGLPYGRQSGGVGR
jgi:hypothetical protein